MVEMEETKKLTAKEYNKIYYETNKDKLTKSAREKILCPLCDKCISRDYLAKHKKTSQCRPNQNMLNIKNLKAQLKQIEEKIEKYENPTVEE